jgi:hypothetical protein
VALADSVNESRGRNALWKLPVLWKNPKTVFPQHLEPAVHSSHNAGCWVISKHNFSCTPVCALMTKAFSFTHRTKVIADGTVRKDNA